jgi:hypothetical protein
MIRVTEIGGWDGSLAKEALNIGLPIQHWLNLDVVTVPKVVEDPRYKHDEVDFHFFYDEKWPVFTKKDVLVATHMIEHLSDDDFIQFVRFIQDFPFVYFEAPLHQNQKSDWTDYVGTHILTYSWDTIEALMRVYGYKCQTIAEGCKLFTKTTA